LSLRLAPEASELGVPTAAIVGLAGLELGDDERALFMQANPLGFILFARNCRAPAQVKALIADLRDVVGRADAPILIDQEGGRVQRLQPPHWRAAPPADVFGRLAAFSEADGVEAAWLNARLVADELAALGITHDCWPVLDIPQPGADGVIGDRAFCDDPHRVAMLGRAVATGLMAGGIVPIIKHIPGHGRATVDSHKRLPVVDTEHDRLRAVDFAPFAMLNDMPWAMTAHVVYRAIDPERPATTSETVIGEVIRGEIGFEGVLVSDDLCMEALSGTPAERVHAALAAGCDIVLHCNGLIADTKAVLAASPPLSPTARGRLEHSQARPLAPQPLVLADGQSRLSDLMNRVSA
jgi:beta-N-acetylhexosaminidase